MNEPCGSIRTLLISGCVFPRERAHGALAFTLQPLPLHALRAPATVWVAHAPLAVLQITKPEQHPEDARVDVECVQPGLPWTYHPNLTVLKQR